MTQEHLVFDTQEAAQGVSDAIYVFGASYAVGQGYSVDGSGIVGRNPDGTSKPSAERTTAWDIPRQRLDGKWIVLHPKYHPAAADPSAAVGLANLLSGITVEAETEAWFTPDDELEIGLN